jgi:type III pantothenate kinase
MILCIDAGNTRIKWGAAPAAQAPFGSWAATGVLASSETARLGDALDALPARHFALAVVSNVAGAAVRERIAQALDGRVGRIEWAAGRARQCGVTCGYDDPAQLGSDRWAALIGARSLGERACLVVSAGTATTVDALDAGGRFLGGLILPGLHMMRQALRRDTAQLADTEGRHLRFPRSTPDAITSGALEAHAGAIERMRAALEPGAPCLLTGGGADALEALIAAPLERVDNLVLEGLALIGRALPRTV